MDYNNVTWRWVHTKLSSPVSSLFQGQIHLNSVFKRLQSGLAGWEERHVVELKVKDIHSSSG